MGTLKERLTAMLQSDLSPNGSSAAYAIMIDGEIIAEDSMGKNPIRGGTYNVGSVSKVYCAIAVMQLVEQGLLNLDAPVCTYLPQFTMPDERYRLITLRHCLSHSSGLPGTQWRWLAAGNPRGDDYYEESYRYFSHSALHSTPGEFSVYCNDGFTLAEMAVSAVTGMSYGEYCKTYITEPLGAPSSRQSSQRNPQYPHTFIVGMPRESIGLEGAGGIGTTMPDLCKFGELFLKENAIISETIKQEITKPQGQTFLPWDNSSSYYGLGWDSVNMTHEDYDLGDGVLDKGGATIQFLSRLIVLPKYNAVLAISTTFDCLIDVKEEILSLFAAAMLERGINIRKHCQIISQEEKDKYEGLYLSSGVFLRVTMDGVHAEISSEDSRGNVSKRYQNLLHQDGSYIWKSNHRFCFEETEGKRYLAVEIQNKKHALGVKAEDCQFVPLSETWKTRLGKNYLIANVFADDLIGATNFNSFALNLIPGTTDALAASFTNTDDKGQVTYFEAALTPRIDGSPSDCLACGALQIPYMGGRDLMNLYFKEENGIEYCECAGYLYRDVSSLEVYSGQSFGESGENQLYVLKEKLQTLPEIPAGRRLLIFREDFGLAYDSLPDNHGEIPDKGFLTFI